MRQSSSPFTDHDVHAALRNTGLIASHRLLEARLYAAQAGALVPDCAPPDVAGGVSTQIALLGLQVAALRTEIDGGSYGTTDALAALVRIALSAAEITSLVNGAISRSAVTFEQANLSVATTNLRCRELMSLHSYNKRDAPCL